LITQENNIGDYKAMSRLIKGERWIMEMQLAQIVTGNT